MKKINRVAILLAALCAGLISCPSGPGASEVKELSGTVSLGVGLSGLPTQMGAGRVNRMPKRATFVPGEVLVKFASGVRRQSALEHLGLSGVTLTQVQALGVPDAGVYRANFSGALKTRSVEDATLELVRQLQVRSDVEWAQPNFIQYPSTMPNDPQYAQQWHYQSINLPKAWNVETGATNPVTVAVVDSGVLSGHPDLQGKLLPGYDFYSDNQSSLDGDGRDGNPEEPEKPGVQGTYHGSHVAGTIAAATNNALGVAGVSWGAKILPVRALGIIGGFVSDITDGMLWAAGINVPGVPANPNPAQIINLSLGGFGACGANPIYQATIDQINAKGAVIVVAAGNDNADARDASPASCNGVITVGATDLAGNRAGYSNFGPRIDLMAPGGDISKSLDGGVLSLSKNDATKEFNYVFEQGTSMSAPHVAGVIALLKSRDPSLTAARALDVLKRSAVPLSATACTGSGTAKLPSDCGAGLIDAAGALNLLGTTTPPTGDFSLSLSPSSATVAPGANASATVNISTTGGFADAVSLAVVGVPTGITATFSGVTATQATLSIAVGATVTKGSYSITVRGFAGAKTHDATLSLSVQPPTPTATIQGTVVLACFYANNACDANKSQLVSVGSGTQSAMFSTTKLEDGQYALIAWQDVNGNQKVDNSDLIGMYIENNVLAVVRPPKASLHLSVTVLSSTPPSAQPVEAKLIGDWLAFAKR